jgi:hypothetical protein
MNNTDHKALKKKYCSTIPSVDPPKKTPPPRSRHGKMSKAYFTHLHLCKKKKRKSCTDNPKTG